MKLSVNIWKEWLICKHTYIVYVIIMYLFINIAIVSILQLELDFSIVKAELINILRLFIFYIGNVFMLMSMINQSIVYERIFGHIHCLLAYKVPLRSIIIGKVIFILLITSFELPILFLIYFGFYNIPISIFTSNIFFIIILISVVILIVFLISFINILVCYSMPKLSKLISIISFIGCFMLFSYYKLLSEILNNYLSSLVIFFVILLLFSYLLFFIANRIPNQLILKK